MTGASVPDYLLEWAKRRGPAEVLRVARERIERHRLGPRSVITVDLTEAERREVGQLLKAGWAASRDPVPTRVLRQELQSHGCTLEELLVATTGPLRDVPAEEAGRRADAALERRAGLDRLVALLGTVPVEAQRVVEAALVRWVIRRRPPLERADAVAEVLAALPGADEPVLLSVLAARVAKDAHALDKSRPLGRAVARFLALRATIEPAISVAGLEVAMAGFVDPVRSGEGWRAAWSAGGVACDAISSQVLVLNLPLAGDAPAVRLCRAAPGEPVWLTLRSLTGRLALARPGAVFVCENPSVVEAAADRLGSASAPLVCTFGRPGLAALRLLDALHPSATLRVRADGDVAGRSIVASLLDRYPAAERWRFPDGFSVFEEEILEELISDLLAWSPLAPAEAPRRRGPG